MLLLPKSKFPQSAVDLVFRMLPHAASIEKDRIGLQHIISGGVTVLTQSGNKHLAVQQVHLAADGLDKQTL